VKKTAGYLRKGIYIVLLLLVPFISIFLLNQANSISSARDANYLSLANQSNDIENCARISNKDTKNVCYILLAKSLRDVEICNNIVEISRVKKPVDPFSLPVVGYSRSSHNPKDSCIDEVFQLLKEDALAMSDYKYCKTDKECEYQLALNLNDSQRCFGFDAKRDSCLKEISLTTKNKELCKKIEENSTRQDCYYFFSDFISDPELCKQLDDARKPDCYFKSATSKGDASYCLHADVKKTECFYNVAVKTSNNILCFQSGNFSSTCWKHFALLEENKEFCALSFNSEECYLELALKADKSDLCRFGGEYTNECFFRLAIVKKRPSLCQNLPSIGAQCPSGKLGHIQNIACRQISNPIHACIYLSSNDTTQYCDDIEEEHYSSQCFRNVGIALSNTEICELSGDFRRNCYYEIAIKESRIDLCKKAGPWRNECKEQIEEKNTSG